MVAQYTAYYENQIGGGASRIGNVFVGAPYQKGHGIGRFLGGLFRSVLPLITKGVKAIGKEALRSGLHVIEDVSGNHVPFKESLRRRAAESGENLKRKADEKIALLMNGAGYNRSSARRTMQSLTGRAPRRIAVKKRSAASGRGKRRGTVSAAKKKKNKRVTKTGKVTKRPRKKTTTTTRKKRRTSIDIFGSV